MKKTYNINISGSIFVIDDDAYTLLDQYLVTLHKAFGNTDEGRELVSDIEARVAEILSEINAAGTQVISAADVAGVIARIGRPEEMMEDTIEITDTPDGTEAEVTQTRTAVPPPYMPHNGAQRKFMRDPQGAMLGGVCAGLAAYTGVDVTWIRLITVALAFVSLSVVAVAYVVLWIVVPEARTPLQRMKMAGEAPTVDNIGRTVTDAYAAQSGSDTPNDPAAERTTWKRFADNMAQICGILARILLLCVLFVAGVAVIGTAVALVGCVAALIVFTTSWGIEAWNAEVGTAVPWLAAEPIVPLLCGIGWILTAGIPMFALCWVILTRNSRRTMTRGWRRALAGTWVLGLLLAGCATGWLTANGAPAFKFNRPVSTYTVGEPEPAMQLEWTDIRTADTTVVTTDTVTDTAEH